MKKVIVVMFLVLFIYGCSGANPQAVDSHDEENEESHEETDAGAEREFESLMGKMDTLKMKVTYEMQDPQTKETMTMSQYMKGENVRMDMATDEGEVRIFTNDREYKMCTNSEGQWSCMVMELTDEQSSAYEPVDVDYDMEDIESERIGISRDGSIQVAGTTAKCFKVSTIGTRDYARYCLSNEGVLLYMKTILEGQTSEIKATSYSTSVPDSDFNTPAGAKMQNMNDMMGMTVPEGMSCDQMCDYYKEDDQMYSDCMSSC